MDQPLDAPSSEVVDELDLSDLPAPTGTPAPEPPAAPAAPVVDATKYVPRSDYEAQLAEVQRLREQAAFAAAPGSRAATEQMPIAPPPPQPPQLTDEQKQKLINAMVSDPLSVIVPIANGIADQKISAAVAQFGGSLVQSEIRGFMADKRGENPDEYKLVEPFMREALKAVPIAQLAGQTAEGRAAYLEVTYRACRGDMYAEASRGVAAPGATAADALGPEAVFTERRPPPPYAGASGAPAQAATANVTRMVQRKKLSEAELDLAKRSGLTADDYKRYAPLVANEIPAV